MNRKTGLDYFSFDVDFFSDEKIQFVSARFGTKGEVIAVRLLCKIYRDGYFIRWDDDIALLFAKGVGDGCQHSCVKDVVFELLKRGFFDRSIFERFSILTSKGIQRRYFDACHKRKDVLFDPRISLIDMDEYKNTVEWQDGNIFDEKGGILDEKVDILPQSKVKESKAKESKGKKKSVADAPPVRYADDPLLDAAICDFIADRKERKKPMTSRAIASLIMQLDALASDVPTKIAILSSQLPGAGRGYSRSKTARERNPPTS